MKYAYIESGTVREVVQSHPATLFSAAYAAQFVQVSDEVQQGWIDTEGTLTAPPVVVLPVVIPQSVTMRQARLALLGAGLLGNVDAAIAAQEEPIRSHIQIEWDYATEIDRKWPTLLALSAALGLTPNQLDDLFITASQL